MNRNVTLPLFFLFAFTFGYGADLSAALNSKPTSIILTGRKGIIDTCDTLSRALRIPIVTTSDVTDATTVSIADPHATIRALMNDIATQADCWWQAKDGFIAVYRNRLFIYSLGASPDDKDAWQRIESTLRGAVPEGCRVGIFPLAGLASASLSPSEHGRFVAAIASFDAKEKDCIPR